MGNYLVSLFKTHYLSPDFPEIITPYRELAHYLDGVLEDGPEKTLALRNLLNSCDSAVRSRRIDLDGQMKTEADRHPDIRNKE